MSALNVTAREVLSSGKVQWIDQAVGAGLLGEYRSNVQHPYDRMKFQNDADLANKSITFFQVPINGTYLPLNSATQVTKTLADTNWDQSNQAQYSYLLGGMQCFIGTQTQQSFLAAPNDLSTWADLIRVMTEDATIEIIAEDNILMRQKMNHIPQGNAISGVSSATGTPAANAVVSQPVVSNGVASAMNSFSFGNSAIWVPKSSRFNVKLTFGPSALAASMAYKPATALMFAEIRFVGMKFQAVS